MRKFILISANNIPLNKNLLKYFSDGFKINIYFDSVEQSLRFDQIIEKFENKYEYKKIIKPLYKGFIDKDEKKLRYTDHEIFNRFHSFKIQKRFSKSKKVIIGKLHILQKKFLSCLFCIILSLVDI